MAYDATRRRARAEARREAILDAAEGAFFAHGYVATTVAGIARSAGVSVETVYKAYTGKAGLVMAIRNRALAGDRAEPAEVRSDAMQSRETDPRAIIRAWAVLSGEVAPRVAPILLLVRAAAAVDCEAATIHAEMEASRLSRMARNARRLHATGRLRAGLGWAAVRDVLWTFTSPELYDLLVVHRRWSRARYVRFVADGMLGLLL